MKIGDIRRQGTNYCIWTACITCGKERWVNRTAFLRPNFKGQCKKCAGNHSKPPRYKGRYLDSEGYIMVQLHPSSPFYLMAEKNGYVKEHRLVMAQQLGRCLLPTEIPHHKNGNVQDNRTENLELKNPSSHTAWHNSNRNKTKAFQLAELMGSGR